MNTRFVQQWHPSDPLCSALRHPSLLSLKPTASSIFTDLQRESEASGNKKTFPRTEEKPVGRSMPRALPSPAPHWLLSSAHPQSSMDSYDSFLTPSQTEPSFHPDNGKHRPGLSKWFHVTAEFSLEILISEVRRFMPRVIWWTFFILKRTWILVNFHGKNRSTIAVLIT